MRVTDADWTDIKQRLKIGDKPPLSVKDISESHKQSLSLSTDGWYDFDIYMHYRDSDHLHRAILEYVLDNFSIVYGLDMHVYYSP
jgi:hypothetical protein